MRCTWKIPLVLAMAAAVPAIVSAETVVAFVDGTRMEVQSYEVKDSLVLLKTKEGKLMSVPRSYVDLAATEQLNRSGPPATPPAKKPAPPPELPRETIEPERPVIAPEPVRPRTEPTAPASPPPPPPPAPSAPNLPASPPPVWANEELRVSLVVPSAAWTIENRPPSFDVAATLANASTEAKATLALIRQEIRGKGDFRAVVGDVEKSISRSPGYQALANGPLDLEPYVAHEFRFVKDGGPVPIFNRIVIVYSRDLAYVLSLSCPESRLPDNEADFEALVRGLVVMKPKKDLRF